MPPSNARSATPRCSTGSVSRTAVRCTCFGLSRFAVGRFGISGGAVKCGREGRVGRPVVPSGRVDAARRGAFGSRGGRAGRLSPSRLPLASRPPLRSDLGLSASFCVTGVNVFSLASISNRFPRCPFSRMLTTDKTEIPSMSKSASTLRTSPVFALADNNEPFTTPLGDFAPAARQVQVPS